MYFVYDSQGFTDATIEDGSYSSNSYSDGGDTITNEERINDQSISTAITSYVGTDAIRVDFGSAVPISTVALYMNAAETDDIYLARASDGTNGTLLATLSTNFNANSWQVTDFTEATYRYFFLGQATGSNTFTGLTEVILGKKLTFEYNPDIGINEGYDYGSSFKTSVGGSEYAIKTHDTINTYKLNFSNISSTFKSNLQVVESAVQSFKKFLWYDGTKIRYVRLVSNIGFTEVAYQRYSASLELREQLT